VLTSGQIESLAAVFAKTWQRPPSEADLKALVDDWVREEIAVREAMAMGLDRDDTVMRRRLRQKLEFLVEDVSAAAPPTEAELQAWLATHPERYRTEDLLELRQVHFSRERRGPAAEADARALLARLEAAGAAAPIDDLGDPSLLPQELPLQPAKQVALQFGDDFAARVAALAPGHWAGPFESAYGLHLAVLIRRVEGSLPALAALRPAVESDLLADRRKRQLEAMYDRLLAKYHVVIEGRPRTASGDVPPKAGS